jgi:uncharacterized LabA/DUF88 family protein
LGRYVKRLAIYIDGSNLYHSLLDLLGHAKIDFGDLVEKLSIGYELYRTYYYNAQINQQADPSGYKSQQKFLSALRALPFFELRLGVLRARGNTWIEEGIDVKVAVDMIGMAYQDQYDVAMLVSGDGDYVDCVRAVKGAGKHVVNAYSESSQSQALRDACDNWICMDNEYLKELLLS